MVLPAASEPSPESISATVQALRNGSLGILPTDTVYGVVADIRCDKAVKALYEAKEKDPKEPLQLLFPSSREALRSYARLSPDAIRLVDGLGPGPWTIITPAVEGWTSPALAGGQTVGVRMPPVATLQMVLDSLGAPLAASSANRHGDPSSTTCAQAIASLGEYCEVALDDGPTPHGIDSTVVDCSVSPPRILREGALPAGTVTKFLGIAEIEVVSSAGARK
ncbi:MAG: threonylcarbamoyl-AMP synthase [Dehalococcoidia bacterium]|nr:threonylcarbamoyl-AMP synthase [Dehalococcoidia bacterium]